MRLLFVLIIVLNILLYSVGKGWLGTPPAEQGRDPARLQQQINPQAVQVEPAQPR